MAGINPLTTIVPHHIESSQLICITWGTLIVNDLNFNDSESGQQAKRGDITQPVGDNL